MSELRDFQLAVRAATTVDEPLAGEVAQHLELPTVATVIEAKHCTEYDALLLVGGGGSRLQQTGKLAPGPVQVEFGNAAMRHRRRSGHNELLGKAVGLSKKPTMHVLDATAGLGRDAFVLADLGCTVSLCERNEVLGYLLSAGISAAKTDGDSWLVNVVSRMKLYSCDASSLPGSTIANVDVIYLDPMFPSREKSANVKKEMALLHRILGAADDADALLEWALNQKVARVVVKRPVRAPLLADCSPSHQITGKAIRYDVYVLKGLQPDQGC